MVDVRVVFPARRSLVRCIIGHLYSAEELGLFEHWCTSRFNWWWRLTYNQNSRPTSARVSLLSPGTMSTPLT